MIPIFVVYKSFFDEEAWTWRTQDVEWFATESDARVYIEQVCDEFDGVTGKVKPKDEFSEPEKYFYKARGVKGFFLPSAH